MVGVHYTDRKHVNDHIEVLLEGPDIKALEGFLDQSTMNIIRAMCVVLISCGVGVTIVASVGFCGAMNRNRHFLLGVSYYTYSE